MAKELDKTLAKLAEDLQRGAGGPGGGGEIPGELLDIFALAQFQYSQLAEHLSRHAPALKHWVVYAARVDEALARGLHNGLLSPKLLVEMEEEREAFAAAARAQGATFESLSERLEHVNGIAKFLTRAPSEKEPAAEGEGALGPQSKARALILPPKRTLEDAKDPVEAKKQRTPADAFLQWAAALR